MSTRTIIEHTAPFRSSLLRANKGLLILFFSLFVGVGLRAQMQEDPATWTIEVKKQKGNDYQIVFHAKLKKTWHIFSLTPGGDGMQIPPKFTFAPNGDVKLKGPITEEGKKITETADGVDGAFFYYEDHVDYYQNATIKRNTKIKGKHTYQVCDHNICLREKEVSFSLDVTDAGGTMDTSASAKQLVAAADAQAADDATNHDGTVNADTAKAKAEALALQEKKTADENKKSSGNKSLLWLFLAALGGGIAAVLTPCVYSMIPITVSFFTKRSKTRKEGLRNALYYSLSIIIIFTLLGVLISAIFGANALNSLSTNWIANLFFFVIFIVFGISFLGAFEITLPSSWTSATDSKAGVGSFGGIFFMALTLAIVSFSCTGPIVGPLLVLAGKGGILGPTIGMFGFSIGLALPFALFAVFPGMLNKMASSGGWLNQVKVVLGFVELMLALKFFSNADLAQGWRLLDREIFIAIWIVLSVLLGLYLLGRLKLSHDDAPAKNVYGQEYVSLFKLFIAIISFSFAVYLLPGMWGAPLNGVSAFVPPMGTFDAFGGSAAVASGSESKDENRPIKYAAELKSYEPQVVRSLGLVTYFDYDEALAVSKKLKKPIMLDFTGINCVNCRKMESQVWSRPEVAKRLKEDFIVVSLYCDINRIVLPKEQQYFSKDLNAQVTTLGDKNTDLEASKFAAAGEPIYFFVDENGNKLIAESYGYNPDVQKFIDHLDKVKENYKKAH